MGSEVSCPTGLCSLPVSQACPLGSWVFAGPWAQVWLGLRLPSRIAQGNSLGDCGGPPLLHCRTAVPPCLTTLVLWEHPRVRNGQGMSSERPQATGRCQPCGPPVAGRAGPGPAPAGAHAVSLLAAIRVSCTGSCRVSSKANDTAWVSEEGYFNSALSLADKGSLPAGEHNFPFQFLLPAAVPTSFEGSFGKIVYQVRATIDTPRFFRDHQCSCAFYILSPLNLNTIPDIEVRVGSGPWVALPSLDALAPAEGRGSGSGRAVACPELSMLCIGAGLREVSRASLGAPGTATHTATPRPSPASNPMWPPPPRSSPTSW